MELGPFLDSAYTLIDSPVGGHCPPFPGEAYKAGSTAMNAVSMGGLLHVVLTLAVAAVAGVAIAVALRPLRLKRQADRLARAQRDFHRQREQLEAKFIERAAISGRPRGLRWTDVEFDDDVIYARDRRTRGLKALVAIEVSFEAVEGGGMEEVEAVSDVRAATAEFLYDAGRWRTEGRVYFNLGPDATVKYLSQDLELVAEEHAGSSRM